MKISLPMTRTSLSKRTMKEMFSDEIVSLITSGILRAGDELPGERDLAELLGVSRETVRGALQLLAERGRVVITHGARTRVGNVQPEKSTIGLSSFSTLNGYNLNDVFRTRIHIEKLVVANAAMRVDDALLARLDSTLDAQKQSFYDLPRYFICDRAFHFLIYSACDNKLLSDFASDLYTYMLDHRRNIADPDAAKRGYGDHCRIVDALRQRNTERSAEAAAGHVDRQFKTTLRTLKQN